MKEVRNKRLVLAGLVVLALLLAGTAAIAIFRETLTADIRVRTGDLRVEFVSPTNVADLEDLLGGPDIAECSASINPNNAQELIVDIQKAYPQYYCRVTATVKNTGNIHAKYEGHEVTGHTSVLSVEVEQAPSGFIAPDATASVVFKVTVTDQAEENRQYSATLRLKFVQALP